MNVLEWVSKGEGLEHYIQLEGGYYMIALRDLEREKPLVHGVVIWGLQHINLIPKYDDFGWYDDYYYVPEEQFRQTFQSVKVIDRTEEGMQKWSAYARRPYYRMVGKRVTPEDAFQLIARYDDCLASAAKERAFEGLPVAEFLERCYANGYCGDNYATIPMSYVDYSWLVGYVSPDGCVGLNHLTFKYPEMHEIFPDFLEMAGGTDKLDVIFILSCWDEREPSRISDWNGNEYITPYRKFDEGDVDFAMHIAPGVIEFLTAKEGLKRYSRYAMEYSGEEVRRFAAADYYRTGKTLPFNEGYFIKMISNFGEVPPDLREAYLEKFRRMAKQ